MSFDKDTWETPDYIFNWLNSRFNFDFDGCASEENKKTELFSDDFLNEDFDDTYRIFVNPPYSNVGPFLAKAKELKEKGHLVVFLLNADKSTKWYENHIHNVANEVIDIIGGRLAFIHPVTKEPMKGNSKGQMVVVFDPTMDDFITRNVSLSYVQEKFNDC